MSASERAARLREQADQLDALGQLEDAHNTALDAYRADPSDETKAAFLAAKDAFRTARMESRGDRDGMTISAALATEED